MRGRDDVAHRAPHVARARWIAKRHRTARAHDLLLVLPGACCCGWLPRLRLRRCLGQRPGLCPCLRCLWHRRRTHGVARAQVGGCSGSCHPPASCPAVGVSTCGRCCGARRRRSGARGRRSGACGSAEGRAQRSRRGTARSNFDQIPRFCLAQPQVEGPGELRLFVALEHGRDGPRAHGEHLFFFLGPSLCLGRMSSSAMESFSYNVAMASPSAHAASTSTPLGPYLIFLTKVTVSLSRRPMALVSSA